jgi:SAM-dependent methyltransferase
VDTDGSLINRAMHFDRPHELHTTLLDLIAANSAVRDLKAWALERLEPGPGERALDVGCGTGEDVRVLAAMVGPHGEARGIEPNAGLRLAAQHRAAVVEAEMLVDDGDAYELPYDDASFDVVRCERVFQHLHEPERAAAEIARVLRPGGRMTVLDTDWGSTVLYPGDHQVVRRMLTSFIDALPNGRCGRRLRALLTEVGLQVDDMHATTWVERPENWLRTPLLFMPSAAVNAAILTPDEAQRLRDQVTSAAEAGTLHFSVTMFGAYARRPPSR